MTSKYLRAFAPVTLALALAGCGGSQPEEKAGEEHGEKEAHADEGAVSLSPQQIAEAGIAIVRPTIGGEAGAIEISGTIEGDPQGVQVVSAAIGGRVVSLTRNLGQPERLHLERRDRGGGSAGPLDRPQLAGPARRRGGGRDRDQGRDRDPARRMRRSAARQASRLTGNLSSGKSG